jgi:hypothetical protein
MWWHSWYSSFTREGQQDDTETKVILCLMVSSQFYWTSAWKLLGCLMDSCLWIMPKAHKSKGQEPRPKSPLCPLFPEWLRESISCLWTRSTSRLPWGWTPKISNGVGTTAELLLVGFEHLAPMESRDQ